MCIIYVYLEKQAKQSELWEYLYLLKVYDVYNIIISNSTRKISRDNEK